MHMPKQHNRLESLTVFVLMTDNKFDFYNITETAEKNYRILERVLECIILKILFPINQFTHFLIIELVKEIKNRFC